MNNPEIFTNPCAICKRKEATQLCDYIISYEETYFVSDYRQFKELNACKHNTCDLPLCKDCAARHGSHDFCPTHHEILKVDIPEEQEYYRRKEKARQYAEALQSQQEQYERRQREKALTHDNT